MSYCLLEQIGRYWYFSQQFAKNWRSKDDEFNLSHSEMWCWYLSVEDSEATMMREDIDQRQWEHMIDIRGIRRRVKGSSCQHWGTGRELISQDQVLEIIALSPFNFAVIDNLSLIIHFFLTNQNGLCHFSPETMVQKKLLCPLYLKTQVWLLMPLESWETSRNKCVKTWRYRSTYFNPTRVSQTTDRAIN